MSVVRLSVEYRVYRGHKPAQSLLDGIVMGPIGEPSHTSERYVLARLGLTLSATKALADTLDYAQALSQAAGFRWCRDGGTGCKLFDDKGQLQQYVVVVEFADGHRGGLDDPVTSSRIEEFLYSSRREASV